MNPFRKIARSLRSRNAAAEDRTRWRKWLEDEQSERDVIATQAPYIIKRLRHRPLISILLPVYNIEEQILRKCLDSVCKQWYPYWELCVADDHSPSPHVRRMLEVYAGNDKRIKVIVRETNGHISAASNSALDLAAGEYTALLDHDDELSIDALFWMAVEIDQNPNAHLLYSDEDKLDVEGRRFDATFKPDWSRDLFYSLNMLNHLSVFRTDVLREIGGFREGFEGSQDYDLALRYIEKIDDANIKHIPRILYHWRAVKGSVALDPAEKSYPNERARTALKEHFDRIGTSVEVAEAPHGWHRVKYSLRDPLPMVSVVLFSYTSELTGVQAANSLKTNSYENVEVECVTIDSANAAAVLNNAAFRAAGDLLCFVEARLNPVSGDWLNELLAFACQESIGAVGAKIIDENAVVTGGAMILGTGTTASYAHAGIDQNASGSMGRNLVAGNFSAVSVRCLVTRREVFEKVGGFDEINLPSILFDVDYCLRLIEKNLRVVFVPHVALTESKQTSHRDPGENELLYLASRWPNYTSRDPFYNSNLSKKDGSFKVGLYPKMNAQLLISNNPMNTNE